MHVVSFRDRRPDRVRSFTRTQALRDGFERQDIRRWWKIRGQGRHIEVAREFNHLAKRGRSWLRNATYRRRSIDYGSQLHRDWNGEHSENRKSQYPPPAADPTCGAV